jgi:hypothetical protein
MTTVIEEVGPITVHDVSGQKSVRLRGVPSDATVNEVVRQLLGDMEMPNSDGDGRPLNYHARLERESRQLGDNERVGDVLQSGDALRLLPNVDAG